jgi:hypothetical protein
MAEGLAWDWVGVGLPSAEPGSWSGAMAGGGRDSGVGFKTHFGDMLLGGYFPGLCGVGAILRWGAREGNRTDGVGPRLHFVQMSAVP